MMPNQRTIQYSAVSNNRTGTAIYLKTRLKKFSPRPRGKYVIGKILCLKT